MAGEIENPRRDIAELYADGNELSAIADELDISTQTARRHVRSYFGVDDLRSVKREDLTPIDPEQNGEGTTGDSTTDEEPTTDDGALEEPTIDTPATGPDDDRVIDFDDDREPDTEHDPDIPRDLGDQPPGDFLLWVIDNKTSYTPKNAESVAEWMNVDDIALTPQGLNSLLRESGSGIGNKYDQRALTSIYRNYLEAYLHHRFPEHVAQYYIDNFERFDELDLKVNPGQFASQNGADSGPRRQAAPPFAHQGQPDGGQTGGARAPPPGAQSRSPQERDPDGRPVMRLEPPSQSPPSTEQPQSQPRPEPRADSYEVGQRIEILEHRLDQFIDALENEAASEQSFTELLDEFVEAKEKYEELLGRPGDTPEIDRLDDRFESLTRRIEQIADQRNTASGDDNLVSLIASAQGMDAAEKAEIIGGLQEVNADPELKREEYKYKRSETWANAFTEAIEQAGSGLAQAGASDGDGGGGGLAAAIGSLLGGYRRAVRGIQGEEPRREERPPPRAPRPAPEPYYPEQGRGHPQDAYYEEPRQPPPPAEQPQPAEPREPPAEPPADARQPDQPRAADRTPPGDRTPAAEREREPPQGPPQTDHADAMQSFEVTEGPDEEPPDDGDDAVDAFKRKPINELRRLASEHEIDFENTWETEDYARALADQGVEPA